MADEGINQKIKIGMPGLGARLRRARTAGGFTQEALAERLEVSWMTVHRWEHDLRPIAYGLLRKISQQCGVEIWVLVPGLACEPGQATELMAA